MLPETQTTDIPRTRFDLKYIDLWMLSTGKYLRLTLTLIQVTLPWKLYSSGHVVTWWIVSSNLSAPFSTLSCIVKLKQHPNWRYEMQLLEVQLTQKVGVKIRTNSQQRHASDDCRWIPSSCIGVDCGWMETPEEIHGRRNLNRDRRGRVGVEGDKWLINGDFSPEMPTKGHQTGYSSRALL